MPLDGLRAWIGEVERKLGMRTRVFLALSAIAIGGAGAAIYLAVDAHNKTVTENDLQTLQRQLEGQIGTGGAGGAASVSQLETKVGELQQQVEQLTGEPGGSPSEKGTGGKESGAAEGGASGGGETGTGSAGGKAGSGDKEASASPPEANATPTPATGSAAARAKLKELIEQAQGK